MAKTLARAIRETRSINAPTTDTDAATIFTAARTLCDQAKSRAAMLREKANAMLDEASALERFSAHTTDGMSNNPPTVGAVGSGY